MNIRLLFLLECYKAAYLTVTVEILQLDGPVENTSCQDNSMDSNNTSVMAIAILAVLLMVLLICVIVLTVFVFKLKMKLQAVDKSNR